MARVCHCLKIISCLEMLTYICLLIKLLPSRSRIESFIHLSQKVSIKIFSAFPVAVSKGEAKYWKKYPLSEFRYLECQYKFTLAVFSSLNFKSSPTFFIAIVSTFVSSMTQHQSLWNKKFSSKFFLYKNDFPSHWQIFHECCWLCKVIETNHNIPLYLALSVSLIRTLLAVCVCCSVHKW